MKETSESQADQHSEAPKHLTYLQDIPLHDDWEDAKKKSKDIFRHGGYIEALYKMVIKCPDRFCIGLFGGWGSGKTGIVKGLERKVKELKDKSGIKLLYFNVWKYSNDSLRRQLLLKIDKDWFGGGLEYEKAMYIDIKQTTQVNSGFSWEVLKKWDRLLFLGVTWSAILAAVYFQSPRGFCGKDWITIIGTAIIPILAIVISAMQGKDKIVKTIEDGSKPTSPEEFEKLFQNALKQPAIAKKRKVFILDDLDRCENEKVLEVLAGISTFLDEPGCIYVIPCDDKRIKAHIRKGFYSDNGDGQVSVSKLEEEDFLKKLFNAHVILRPTVDEHLEQYISALLKEIGVTKNEEVNELQTVLQVGLSKNPRRVKQFLNNLVTGYELAIELEAEGSLTGGVITGKIGFLAKVLFIRDYFPNACEYFETNPGSFKEMETWIGEHQRKNDSLNKTQKTILYEEAESITLRRFIDATSGITNAYPDIFFRFSGKEDIVEIESISNIITAAEVKNMQDLKRLLEEMLNDLDLIGKLRTEIIGRVKAFNKSPYLRTNLVASFININNKVENVDLKNLTGGIIGQTPDDILRSIHKNLTPIVWDMAAKRIITRDKIQVLGNVVFAFMDGNYGGNTMETASGWEQDSAHIQKINENWNLFEKPVQKSFTDVVRRIVEVEIRSDKGPNEDFWNWILPDGGEIPKVIRYSEALRQIAQEIRGDKVNANVRNAGLLVSRLPKLTETTAISSMIERTLHLFDGAYVPAQAVDFAPTIVLDWVIASKQTFNKSTAAKVFDKLMAKHEEWNGQGYDLHKSWLQGLIEIYPKLEETNKIQIKTIVAEQIKQDSTLYDHHYSISKYQTSPLLNFEAIQAFGHTGTLTYDEGKQEWIKKLQRIFEEVYKFKVTSILKYFLKPLWGSVNEHSFNLSTLGIELLAEQRDELDNLKILAEAAFTALLSPDYWINANEDWRERFVAAYLTILDTSNIDETERDDLIRVWMTSFLELEDVEFRKKHLPLRDELYSRLSKKQKEESVNQIWTRIKSNVQQGIDLQSLMDGFDALKTADKEELFDELFEQLNTVEEAKVNLFIKFGLTDAIIDVNTDQWVENVIPFIRQYPDNDQRQQIVEIARDQVELLKKAKGFKELDKLINPPSVSEESPQGEEPKND